jgi:hypothetical protein
MRKFLIIFFSLLLATFSSSATENNNPLKNIKEPTNEAEALEIKNLLLAVDLEKYKLQLKNLESFNDQVIKNNKCGTAFRCKKLKELYEFYKFKMTEAHNSNKAIIEKNHQILIKPFTK